MKAIRTITSTLLAALVLVSSTSFVVGMHLCMGEVQEIVLFAEADGCQKTQSLPPCHRQAVASCCQDATVIHDAEDFQAASADLQVISVFAVAMEQPHMLLAEVIPASTRSRAGFVPYDPPLPPADLTIEHRVFLI